jgi:hypothetical protein
MRSLQRRFAPLVIIVAIFASLSCSFSPSGTPETKPTNSPFQATAAAVQAIATAAAQQLKATPSASSTETATMPGAAPELNSLRNNTDQLTSYRMALTLAGTGKDDQGKPANQSLTFVQEVVKAKNTSHFMISAQGMADIPASLAGGNFDYYQMEKQSYLYTKKVDDKAASCVSFGSDQSTSTVNDLDPTEMMKDIQTDRLLGKGETVNGVAADHYTVTKSAMGFGTVTSENSEAWIAQDGGTMVKFIGTAEGNFDFSTKFTGTLTWTYDLTDVNKDFTIELPPECAQQQQATADIPVPENATKYGNLGSIITFSSPDVPKDVAKFYRDNLPGKGWTIKDDSSMGTIVTLTISKDGKSMSIMISPGENDKGSSVIITPAQ